MKNEIHTSMSYPISTSAGIDAQRDDVFRMGSFLVLQFRVSVPEKLLIQSDSAGRKGLAVILPSSDLTEAFRSPRWLLCSKSTCNIYSLQLYYCISPFGV